MKLGINVDCCGSGFPLPKALKAIKENGFTHVFLDSFTEAAGAPFDEAAPAIKEAGLIIDFCHGPFHGINAIYEDNQAGEDYYKYLWENIDKCAKYDIPGIIFHLSSGETPPRLNDLGFSRFCALFEHGRECGVRIHFENIRTLANLASILEGIPDAGFCWDVGHEACFAWGLQYMPLFGKRLSALHLHDNHGIHDGDDHMIPYDACLDYERIANQIAASPFNGTVMLEVFNGHYPDLSPEEFFVRAGKAAQRLESRIAQIRRG